MYVVCTYLHEHLDNEDSLKGVPAVYKVSCYCGCYT
jgi:hypothetical protein